MKFLNQLLAAMLLWIFVACNRNSSADTAVKDLAFEKSSVKAKSYKFEAPQANMGTLGNADTTSFQQNAPLQKNPSPAKTEAKEDWDKKIIKTGNLTMEVKNYGNFNAALHSDIKKLGGYVAQEEQNQSEYKIENIVTIKVPVDQFDNAVLMLTPTGEKVVEKKITSEDVTAELVDTKSRMEAKKRVRDRYLDLLKQAKNMGEILQVQTEVDGIQENIESAAGRIGYLGHAAAFSTINITYYQILNAAPVNDPNPSYSVRLLESFRNGLHWFAELFIMLVSLWPLWMGITVAWIFIRRIKLSPSKKRETIS